MPNGEAEAPAPREPNPEEDDPASEANPEEAKALDDVVSGKGVFSTGFGAANMPNPDCADVLEKPLVAGI